VATDTAPTTRLTVHDRAVGTGGYRYLTFDVPGAATRMDAALHTDRPAMLGLWLLDTRGQGSGVNVVCQL
jgi:hypothetical protein